MIRRSLGFDISQTGVCRAHLLAAIHSVDESIEFDPPIDVLDDEEDETCYGFLPSEPMKGDPHFTTAAPVPAPAVPEAAPAQVTVQAPEVAAAPAQPPRYRIKKRRIEPEPATEPT